MTRLSRRLSAALFGAALLASCGDGHPPLSLPSAYRPPEPMAHATAGIADQAAALDLGRRLFHDRRISLDQQRSCATCHVPWRAFSGRVVQKLEGGRRDVPPLLGAARRESFGWEGQWPTLEEANAHPFGDPDGFGGSNLALLRTFAQDGALRARFAAATGRPATQDEQDLQAGVVAALTVFVATLDDANTPFDRAVADGHGGRLAADARRGWQLFRDEGCVSCHISSTFTDEQLRWHGLPLADDEREEFAEDDPLGALVGTDREQRPGDYRTPSLRNVTLSAPYMHDGRFATLDDVFDFYTEGADEHRVQTGLRRVDLSQRERADLIAFFTAIETPRPPLAEIGEPAAPPRAKGQPVGEPAQGQGQAGRPAGGGKRRQQPAAADGERLERPRQQPAGGQPRRNPRQGRAGAQGGGEQPTGGGGPEQQTPKPGTDQPEPVPQGGGGTSEPADG